MIPDPLRPPAPVPQEKRAPYQTSLPEELAEEQGWVARMIHLFRSDDLDTHFQVSGSPFYTKVTHG